MRAALARLVAIGAIREALELISTSRLTTHDERALECEFEAIAGNRERAYELAARLIASGAAAAPLARALCVAARIDLRAGRFAEGQARFARAFRIASDDGDRELLALVQGLRVEALLSYHSLEAAAPHLAEYRRAALRGASHPTLFDLHLLLANVEFKCGHTLRALHELDLAAEHIVEPAHSVRLAQLQQAKSIVLGNLGKVEKAAKCALDAADLAESVGAGGIAAASYNNLAHYSVSLLDSASARRALSLASTVEIDLLRAATELDSAIAFGDVEGAQIVSSKFSGPALADQSSRSLWFLLTNCSYHTSIGQASVAIEFGEPGLDRALRLSERGMVTKFRYQVARAYALLGRHRQASELVEAELDEPSPIDPEGYADLQRALGMLALAEPDTGAEHLSRASRVFAYNGNRFGAMLADRDASKQILRPESHAPPTELPISWSFSDASSIGFRTSVLPVNTAERKAIEFALRSVAATAELWPNAMLAGEELLVLLSGSGCARSIQLTRVEAGLASVLAYVGGGTSAEDTGGAIDIFVGRHEGADIQLVVWPQDEMSSRFTVLALRRLLRHAATAHENAIRDSKTSALWPEPPPEQQFGFICAAESMLGLLAIARRLAASNIPVLITGETGTGKELLARALHFSSPRAGKRFLPYNCTAVPRDMLDSQLFGYRRGAFTGAQDAFPGVIRSAAGGTLFLDEIGEISSEVQPKLLRFLESSEVHPLGEPAPVHVDVRIVAATNANLETLVANGKFREDLFYRLNVVKLTIPPLRERREEIPLLLDHFLERSQRESSKNGVRFSDIAIEYLLLYDWPGNVRELANEVRRAVALAESGAVLMPEHLSSRIAASRRTIPTGQRPPTPSELIVRRDQPLSAAIEHVERAMIQDALRRHANVEDAAKALGLSRKGLYLKRQRLKIDEASLAS